MKSTSPLSEGKTRLHCFLDVGSWNKSPSGTPYEGSHLRVIQITLSMSTEVTFPFTASAAARNATVEFPLLAPSSRTRTFPGMNWQPYAAMAYIPGCRSHLLPIYPGTRHAGVVITLSRVASYVLAIGIRCALPVPREQGTQIVLENPACLKLLRKCGHMQVHGEAFPAL